MNLQVSPFKVSPLRVMLLATAAIVSGGCSSAGNGASDDDENGGGVPVVSSVQASASSVNEGEEAVFTVQGTANASFAYTVTGVSATDVSALSGTVNLDAAGAGQVTLSVLADQQTEGTEALKLTVDGKTATVEILDTSTTPAEESEITAVTPLTETVNEGSQAQFSVEGTPGKTFEYAVTGVGSADVDEDSGMVTLDGSGKGEVSIGVIADQLTEGPETLILTVAGKSGSITVNDTSTTPVVGSDSAKECLNPEFNQDGTHILTEYNTTDGQSGEVLHWTSDATINTGKSFNGFDATEQVADVVQTSPTIGTATSQTKSYYSFESDQSVVSSYGAIVQLNDPFPLTTTLIYDPEIKDSFALKAGESLQQTYTVTTQTSFGNFESVVDDTRSYFGREQVVVPAGTFESCKFEQKTITTTDGTTTTSISLNWFDVGSGVLLRAEAEGDVTELLSGSVNGAQIQ